MDTHIVVNNREANYYDDSDFYTTFYNEGKTGIEAFDEVMVCSTRFAGGYLNYTVNASKEIKDQYLNDWLPRISSYESRNKIRHGSIVYSPNARKYKSSGVVREIAKDRYDSRCTVMLVEFAEGTAWIRSEKLVKLQDFIPSYI